MDWLICTDNCKSTNFIYLVYVYQFTTRIRYFIIHSVLHLHNNRVTFISHRPYFIEFQFQPSIIYFKHRHPRASDSTCHPQRSGPLSFVLLYVNLYPGCGRCCVLQIFPLSPFPRWLPSTVPDTRYILGSRR